MRHDPASAAVVVMLRDLRMHGMAQAVGYSLAAPGPFLAGSLFDFTANWNYVFVLMLALAGIKLYTGLGAARQEEVSLE